MTTAANQPASSDLPKNLEENRKVFACQGTARTLAGLSAVLGAHYSRSPKIEDSRVFGGQVAGPKTGHTEQRVPSARAGAFLGSSLGLM